MDAFCAAPDVSVVTVSSVLFASVIGGKDSSVGRNAEADKETSVVVVGAARTGTVTDIDGHFSLEVPAGPCS